MSGVNKWHGIGHLGNDPEARNTQSGTSVCNFTVACGETFKDRDGNKQERTEWVRCVAWQKLADICTQYLHKGKQVYVAGRMQTREWLDKDNNKRYTTEIILSEMRMLGKAGDSAHGYTGPATPAPKADQVNDDDLPF